MNTADAKDAAIFEQKPPLRTLRDDERRTLLANGTSGVLATVGPTGYPHLSTMLYVLGIPMTASSA